MNTTVTLRIIGCILFIFLLVVSAVPKQSVAASKQPNIIFILTDDQRLEDVEHMPNTIRLLRDQGMSFSNYFSNVSLCCPSRATILRGQYAHNTGVMTNKLPNGGFRKAHELGIENSTVATWLHDRGYRTALVGKYLNQYPGNENATYIPPGWDYWASAVKSHAREYGEYDYTLNENGKLVSYGHEAKDYGTDVYAGKANDFILTSMRGNKPFFLYLGFYAPHAPATPAPRHLGLFADAKVPRTKAFNEVDVSTKPNFIQNFPPMTEEDIKLGDAYYGRRLAALQAVDEAIASIYKTIGDGQQLENTYIVFASDNGYHLGEHRLRYGKQTAYETDIHLPLIVRGPGIHRGSTADELSGNIDLAPTFCDVAGASLPDFVDGRSLLPICHGNNQTDLPWRKEFLVEHWRGGRKAGRRVNSALAPQSELVSPAVYRPNQASDQANEQAGDNAGTPELASTVGSQASTDCHHSPCCTECSSATPCYCGSASPASAVSTNVSGVVSNDAACEIDRHATTSDGYTTIYNNQCRAGTSRFQQVSYKGTDSKAMEEEDDEALAGSAAPKKLPQESPRTLKVGPPDPTIGRHEFGNIPALHALRSHDGLYVEYSTGEREFYRLTEDPDEINNLVSSPKVHDEVNAKHLDLNQLKHARNK